MIQAAPISPSASKLLVAASLSLCFAVAGCAQPAVQEAAVEPSPSTSRPLDVTRGQLLYDTYCIACHTAQVHWRDHTVVGSWSDLLMQVDRWQRNSGQAWSASEIEDVAAYLNALYYRMPCAPLACRGQSTAARAVPRWTDGG